MIETIAKNIKELPQVYRQKSKMILLPLTGIKRSNSSYLINTYIAGNGLSPGDMRLIAHWKPGISKEFIEQLQGLPTHDYVEQVGGHVLTVFNLENYSEDWDHFLQAKYSKLSPEVKKAILVYYSGATEWPLIESYLYPDKYMVQYHKLLEVSMKLLKYVGQLCDPPDLQRETLKLE